MPFRANLVAADKHDNLKVVSAKYLLRKLRSEKAQATIQEFFELLGLPLGKFAVFDQLIELLIDLVGSAVFDLFFKFYRKLKKLPRLCAGLRRKVGCFG